MPNNSGDKRRLPVVQAKGDADDGEPRPGWHWVGFGAVAIFIVWLPLAYVAALVGPAARPVLMVATHVLALLLAGMAGGFLVTRFGPETRRRDAAYAGLAVGLIAVGLTYAKAGVSIAPLIVPALAAAAAALGGHLGAKKV